MADNKNKRGANGAGTVRQRPDGKWEARCTINGKRRSFYADKQSDAVKRMREALKDDDDGVNIEPTRLTFGQWLEVWLEEYSKPQIKVTSYLLRKNAIQTHIKPALGDIKLQKLTTTQIQHFYNGLTERNVLQPESIKTQVHATIRTALNQAQKLGYIKTNVSLNCSLPSIQKTQIKPFTQEKVNAFLKKIQGHRFENIYKVTLFTGMRLGEVLGLPWSAVDFEKGTMEVRQQLYPARPKGTAVRIEPSTKSGKPRRISPAPFIMELLKEIRKEQTKDHLALGFAWKNEFNLVFVNKEGRFLDRTTVSKEFRKIAEEIGCRDMKFHDLRHTYAVLALQAGDDPKTVQESLGHATAAFTLDVYAHVTEDMTKASANRMQSFYDQLQKKA